MRFDCDHILDTNRNIELANSIMCKSMKERVLVPFFLLLANCCSEAWGSPPIRRELEVTHVHELLTSSTSVVNVPRHLQSASCEQLQSESNTDWGPLRIGYEILGTEGDYLRHVGIDKAYAQRTNRFSAKKKSFLQKFETPLLERALGYWSRALQTRRYGPVDTKGAFFWGGARVGSAVDRDRQLRACGFSDAGPRTGWFVENVDVYLFVTIDDPFLCTGRVLAAAGPCGMDQCGRPIAGSVTMCTNGNLSDLDKYLDFNLATLTHEIAHVL